MQGKITEGNFTVCVNEPVKLDYGFIVKVSNNWNTEENLVASFNLSSAFDAAFKFANEKLQDKLKQA